MDDSASKRSNIEFDKLFGLYLKIESLKLPSSTIKQKKSVIKYTRLPEYKLSDQGPHRRCPARKTATKGQCPVTCSASWSPTCMLEPRFRRIITIDDPRGGTQRSLRSEIADVPKKMTSDICKRKILRIEDDEHSLHPKFSHDSKKTYTNFINRAIETDIKEEKQISQRKVSRLSPTAKSAKDNKSSVIKKTTADLKVGNRYKYLKGANEFNDYVSNKSNNEPTRGSKNTNITPKLRLSKKVVTSIECEKEVTVTKNKYKDESINTNPPKKSILEKIDQKSRSSRSLNKSNSNKITFLNNKKGKNKTITIIKVPLNENMVRHNVGNDISQSVQNNTENTQSNVHSNVQALSNTEFKDVGIETDLLSNKIDQVTETDEDLLKHCIVVKQTFDSLDIPNVSLTNPKSETPKDEIYDIINKKETDLNIKNSNLHKSEQKIVDSYFHKSASYIIGRATLTYTTKQKIDFHVVENNDILQSHLPSSHFPLNVVSVFNKEMKTKSGDSCDDRDENKSHDGVEYLNDLTSVDSSYIFGNDKLVKPSDIISTIKVNDSLLQSDYISEQFQRELNFIDSFFESLQYLESCSLTDKCMTDKKVESWINNSGNELKQFEDESFLTKFENDVDDTKTMASRSLCLLNLLIRNEQRRAKNLLFVLKMREDALKNFTKSQILWLENKKGQENIDISTLKKKQRGALLKLQHECGEMQRMRKALLTLSEKRKLAFMKTKKNIELKLRNSADVEQIILGKKKLKRSTSADRNAAPLKCFELSSSGCDDSATSRPKSHTPVLLPATSKIVTSAEKFVQTAENVPTILQVDQSVETAEENIIVVDGGYLNILFRNFLPQIFSSGKQYEVNKEALNTMVHTSHTPDFNLNCDNIIGKIMEQIKNHESDRPHTPSTARSLVEEFDQIYKDLTGEDLSFDNCIDCSSNSFIDENKDAAVRMNVSRESECDSGTALQTDEVELDGKISLIDESCTCEPVMLSVETQSQIDHEASLSVSGPLPVPAGEAAVSDDVPPELANWVTEKSSTTATIGESSSSNQSLYQNPPITSPVLHEAEELRRQQLAIEREIKALEEQQCQLLAVREIPDKPPPPYTPPAEPRTPKQPRKYVYDTITEQKVCEYISSSKTSIFDSDPYDIFLKDFCQESIQQQKLQISEKYWDTCNILSPQPSNEKLAKKTAQDLKEVLTSVAPTVVSGVGARRSDHIDDILFAEWRRCEPEWTSLHADEVIVKNQVFESIFQRVLTETIDEYKKNVLPANKAPK